MVAFASRTRRWGTFAVVLVAFIAFSCGSIFGLIFHGSSIATANWGTTTPVQKTSGGGRPDQQVALQLLLASRVCGSPAVDGYAYVNASCLYNSPTAQWWRAVQPSPGDLEVHIELGADYDGVAVAWGIDNKKKNVEECAEACKQHKTTENAGPFGKLPCNAFCYCADEVCFEPDAHKHTKGDCWLKFTEGPASPEVNMRGQLDAGARERHPSAPAIVQWQAGVLLPSGVVMGNGTWSPRYWWL